MINRNKLEHILEYAKQQRYIGQSCKVPPEDMVEIMERLLSACNSPAIPDGYVMVPKEPTAEMISSGIAAHYDRSQIQIHDRSAPGPMECAYVAMLAALARRAVYESDMAALSPEEKAEFQARIDGFKALIAQPVQAVPDEYFIILNEGQPYDVFADKDEAAFYAADTSGLFSVLPVSSVPQSVRVPDGWKLVPEIPDSHMITAWKDANYNNASLESALRKMLNAAPEPPQAMQMSDEAQSRELFEKWCSVNIECNKSHPEFYAHLPAREQWAAWEACRAAMLAAAPQSPGSEPATVPGKWIPVSERVPTKQDGSVFLTWNGQYIGKELFLMGSFQCLKPEIITHWMQLPAAPKEVK